MENLPKELLITICEEMDYQTLSRFTSTYRRAYDTCERVYKRKKDEEMIRRDEEATRLITKTRHPNTNFQKLQQLDPTTWHRGSARIVQYPSQPIILTLDEFLLVSSVYNDINNLFYNGYYYVTPIDDFDRLVNLKFNRETSKYYPYLS